MLVREEGIRMRKKAVPLLLIEVLEAEEPVQRKAGKVRKGNWLDGDCAASTFAATFGDDSS